MDSFLPSSFIASDTTSEETAEKRTWRQRKKDDDESEQSKRRRRAKKNWSEQVKIYIKRFIWVLCLIMFYVSVSGRCKLLQYIARWWLRYFSLLALLLHLLFLFHSQFQMCCFLCFVVVSSSSLFMLISFGVWFSFFSSLSSLVLHRFSVWFICFGCWTLFNVLLLICTNTNTWSWRYAPIQIQQRR